MLLSTAMRLGSMLNPQSWLFLTERDSDGSTCATCALGAICEAVGLLEDEEKDYEDLNIQLIFPAINKPFHPTPYELARVTVGHKMPMSPDTLAGYISCLNDTGYYSREWIADWLVESGNDCESVEQPIAKTVEVEQAVTA